MYSFLTKSDNLPIVKCWKWCIYYWLIIKSTYLGSQLAQALNQNWSVCLRKLNKSRQCLTLTIKRKTILIKLRKFCRTRAESDLSLWILSVAVRCGRFACCGLSLFWCFCAAHLCLNKAPSLHRPSLLLCDASPPQRLDHNFHQRSMQRTNPGLVWADKATPHPWLQPHPSLLHYLSICLQPACTCGAGDYFQ